MDYTELRERVAAHPRVTEEVLGRLLAFSTGGRIYDIGYTLAPQGDGTFLVYRGDDRGGATPVADPSGAAVVFPDEDAACRWVLGQIERNPQAPSHPDPVDDPQIAANRAAQEARVRERIAQLRAQKGE